MIRPDDARKVKIRLPEYLQPAKKRVAGKITYICPFCGNGSGRDGDGMCIDPNGDGTQAKCFKCGFYGDILDIYMKQHNCDVVTAFKALCNHFKIEISGDVARASTGQQNEERLITMRTTTEDPLNSQIEDTDGNIDYMEYYRVCREQLKKDPAALGYLSSRGISIKTATDYWLGYDVAADPANAPGAINDENKRHPCKRLIIPFDRAHYMGRRIDGGTEYKKINSKSQNEDDTVPPFNLKALYNEDGRPVFITEGALDALSIIEAGSVALATNSTSNIRRIIDALAKKRTSNTLILCFDNDDAGRRASTELASGLQNLGISFKSADIVGECKDPNEALTKNRGVFIAAVKAVEGETRYAGLLTYSRAIETLEAVDDRYLELPAFPQLSAITKIRTHDTIVIAADTGAGKSSLSLNILHGLQDRYPSLYINLEMDTATVLQRLVSIHTGLNLDVVEGYKHDENTRNQVNAAIYEIAALRETQILEDIYDIKQIEAHIQAATKGRTEPTIVFIDTGLLVTLPNKSASRYERFTQISEELRRISRLNNIIMFVLLQQNREGKKEDQKAPTNSSLKESGSWENDATKIMFLWNNPQTKCKELVITKNRNGKSSVSIPLDYYPQTQIYKEQKGFIPLQDEEQSPWDNAPCK